MKTELDLTPKKPEKKLKSSSGKKLKEEIISPSGSEAPIKKKKRGAVEEEEDVWRWWEEEKKEDGIKWKSLQHQGPLMAPLYVPLPKSVKFRYNGKVILKKFGINSN